jgi:glyoxylase-like metal-dependent hydrolase (beta-lactamase superfamily II)
MIRQATILCAAAALAFAFAVPNGPIPAVFAAAPQQRSQAPGFYRMMLGDFEVTALLDGTHPSPDEEVLTHAAPDPAAPRTRLFAEDRDRALSLLAAADLPAPTEGSINAFLINTGKRLVLIDSGAGSLYGDCCGHLIENLRAAGYQPEQVDEVLLTHLHADHVGGIAPHGRMAFPNAVVRAGKADATYWLSAANEQAAPAFLHGMFEGARAALKPYIDQNKFRPIEGDEEIVPGIMARSAPGHTPGHSVYAVESKGQKLLVWGDVIHLGAIQFLDPSVTVKYDSDEAKAQAMRESLLAEAVRDRFWIAAAHISFPGLGHVGPAPIGFTWIPANYTTQLGTPSP